VFIRRARGSRAGDDPRRAGEKCRQMIAETDNLPILLRLALALPRVADCGRPSLREGSDVRDGRIVPVMLRWRLGHVRPAVAARRTVLSGLRLRSGITAPGARAGGRPGGPPRSAPSIFFKFELYGLNPVDDDRRDLLADELDDGSDRVAVLRRRQHER